MAPKNRKQTIHRRKRDTNFTVLDNALVQNRTLSYEARGLLSDLLSRPDDWEVKLKALQIPGKCGRDKLYRIITELIHAGYVQPPCPTQDPTSGKLTGWSGYEVSDTPVFLKTRNTVNPKFGKPEIRQTRTYKVLKENKVLKEQQSTDNNKASAAALIEIGIDSDVAEKLAKNSDPTYIAQIIEIAKGKDNPAGYARVMIENKYPATHQPTTEEIDWKVYAERNGIQS